MSCGWIKIICSWVFVNMSVFKMLRNIQKLLASWQTSFALQCGHANQLAFCVFSSHTVIVFYENAPLLTFLFLVKGISGPSVESSAFYNHLFPGCSLSLWSGSEKMMQGCEMDCKPDSAEGKACQKVHRNFRHKQRGTWPDLGWWGLKAVLSGQGIQTALSTLLLFQAASCHLCNTGDALDRFSPSQTKDSMSHYKQFPSEEPYCAVYSEQALSTSME